MWGISAGAVLLCGVRLGMVKCGTCMITGAACGQGSLEQAILACRHMWPGTLTAQAPHTNSML